MVIIFANLEVLECPMLYTKFHDSLFQRRRFLKVFTIMGMVAGLVMWPGAFEQTFVPLSYEEAPYEILLCPVVSEEKMFEECGRWRRTDGQRRPVYPISSPMRPAQVS